jgi:hypothetical protein
MSDPPPGLILTDTRGLSKAVVGVATVWTRCLGGSSGMEWSSESGEIYFRLEVAMFRYPGGSPADEPLSEFDGYTQP